MPKVIFGFDVSGIKKGANEAQTALDKVGSSTDNATKKLGLFQDAQGRWRSTNGRVATDAEKAAAGLDKVGKSSKGAALQFDGMSNSVSTAKDNIVKYAAQITALIGAYQAVGKAFDFVKRGVDFSASLEASQISIASVVAATNNISDAQGKTLSGVEKFNAANEISASMMEEIQVLALQSTATFDSLADSVAGIVAPATKAGVEIEKLPKFAVSAAQAMTTMRIPIEQMRTELEALLTGNINKAQDILATNLGITGDMVRSWKEQGILMEEIEKRMESFVIAGAKVADSWVGLKSNMADALDYLSGVAGKGVFEGVKQSYRELLDLMVQSEGNVGVGKDFENIMQLITDIENAIGDQLLETTRTFVDELRELNKPENLANFKEDLKDIWGTATTAFDAIKSVGNEVLDLFGDIVQSWQRLPEPIREYGLLFALIGGWKAKLALASIAKMSDEIAGLSALASGELTFKEYLGYGKTLSEYLDDLEKEREKIELGGEQRYPVSQEVIGKETGTSTQIRYGTSSAMGDGKPTKAGKSEVEKFLERSERYQIALDKLRTQVVALEQSLDPSMSGFDKLAAKLEAERQSAYATAEANEKLALARKNATPEQAAETRGLEERKADAEYQSKLNALENQNLQDKASFYSDLATKTGDYSTSLDYQNQILEKQRAEWEAMKIPMSDIEQMLELQRLELARDPWSGFTRGIKKAELAANNWAANIENVTVSAIDGLVSSLTDFMMTGEMTFANVAQSFTRMTLEMINRWLIMQAITGIGNLFLGGLVIGGGGGASGNAVSFDAFQSGAGAGYGLHNGGIAGRDASFVRHVPMSIFDGAPKFHNGGYVGANEVPAILLKGERVLNPQETRAYNAGMNASDGQGFVFNQTVNIEMSQSSGETNEDNARYIGEQVKKSTQAFMAEFIANQRRQGGMLSKGFA